ncbi:DUF2861 family protein [Vibrio hannami]|uniref:DUF2861 family protein n=1 Tax=Vibrio hannami TaxID=2717094 RepID=UPI00240EBDFB|nr:DUF2861 family protein [Vibrio hannami]MDG3085480.1 DUF2861 family protein [Vibrio hannami]
MRNKLLTALLLFTPFSANTAENWFEGSSPLIKAHQMLLDGNLEESFSSLIQVWQNKNDAYMESHLNQLLLKALETDCGKSLSSTPLAEWLDEVVIRRQSIQSPGRRTERVIVDVVTKADIEKVSLVKWPNDAVSDDSEYKIIEESDETIHSNIFSLNQRLGKGLYKVIIRSASNGVWESWIVMGEAAAKQVVRWETKDKWTVDTFGLLNPYCALPVMDIGLYDYVDEQYKQIWKRSYESDYPKTLPLENIKADRYVLAVSITHKRWQGAITIEEQQVISKTHDISEE